MDNATRPEPAPERPAQPRSDPAAASAAVPASLPPGPPHLADPRALTILTTEHWGLLTARSLVYNESFARAGMFLTFLSASLIAMGFVAQDGSLAAVPVVILALDLFVGLATLGRLVDCLREDLFALQAMSRVRHAYLEMSPGLDPYVSTSRYDDFASIATPYGPGTESPVRGIGAVVHGFTTAMGMVAVINAAIAAGLVAVAAMNLGAGAVVSLVAAFVVGVAVGAAQFGAVVTLMQRESQRLPSRFPAPGAERIARS